MRIFLSGPMGSGKSTVAQELGALTGFPVVDLDARIARLAGKSIPEIFAAGGEPAFRELERRTFDDVCAEASDAVIALGGGAVTNVSLRRTTLAKGLLVTLDASAQVLASRVGNGEGRPLLAGQSAQAIVERLDALKRARAAAYAECHLRIDTGTLAPAAIARRIQQETEQPPIVVPLGERTYPIVVGSGVRAQVAERVRQLGGVSKILVVTDTEVGPRWQAPLLEALASTGIATSSVVLAPGESAKHLQSVDTIWNAALDAGLDRRSLVIGLGGGVIGDLSGFAAATILRGIRVAHLPSTLLAMVDSSVGGKTGFDTRHGKNLIGAFHQPSFVLADVELLGTLPEGELRAGLAEVAKSAWIDGEASVQQLERDAAELRAAGEGATARGASAAWVRAIEMSVRLKARIVTEDEHEAGARALLNLGHTLGHAIEASLGYSGMRHGEAVALGMVAAFRVAQRLGKSDAANASRAVSLLAALGLPVDVDRHLRDEVFAFLGSDKKRVGTTLSYIVPAAPGAVDIVKLPVAEVVRLLRA